MSDINEKIVHAAPVPPFVTFVASAVPMVFDNSMSYYEALCALWKWLQDDVIDVINNNASVTESYISLTNEMKEYIDHYFDNLDVQQEINNKLDAMYDDGRLQEIFKNYFDDEINEIKEGINEQFSVQDTVLAAQNAKIANLESTGPIPVNSVDDMTDTTKIYVLVSSGKWYWYNTADSTWTIGGDYQAAQSTDVVSGLEYNQLNEDIKHLLGFVLGTINSNSGATTASTTVVAMQNPITLPYDVIIPCTVNTKFTVYNYDENDALTALPYCNNVNMQGNDKKPIVIRSGTKFKIVLDYVVIPEGGRPTLTDVETSALFLDFKVQPYAIYLRDQIRELETSHNSYNYRDLKYYMNFIIGDNQSAGTANYVLNYYGIGNNRRLVTYDILEFPYDVVIPHSTGFTVYLVTFSADYSTTTGGWKNITSNDLVISAGTKFRLTVANNPSSDTTPLYDIYDNTVFKSFHMYIKDNVQDVNECKLYSPYKYVKSVAHQGYSTNPDENYGNSRLSSVYGAKQHNFDVMECDIKWTSDNVPVCSHDSSFDSGGETVVIADHTWSDLQNYTYHHETIASFEQILNASKILGLEIYVDHISGGWSDQQWAIMFGLVQKYQMEDKTTWLQGIARSVSNRILAWYPKAKIAFVISSADLSASIAEANAIKTVNNEVMIDFNYEQVTTASLLSQMGSANAGIKFGVWTVDNITTCLSYLPYVDAITSNDYSIKDINDKIKEDSAYPL